MKMTPVESKVPRSKKKDLQAFLDEFSKYDRDTVEIMITDSDYKNAYTARASISHAIIRYGYGFKVFVRGKRLYLTKE